MLADQIFDRLLNKKKIVSCIPSYKCFSRFFSGTGIRFKLLFFCFTKG